MNGGPSARLKSLVTSDGQTARAGAPLTGNLVPRVRRRAVGGAGAGLIGIDEKWQTSNVPCSEQTEAQF